MIENNHFDVIIIGAGISGISAAYYIQKECPNKTFAILESRDAIGGTWDLFRYPGIRSDSDMATLGFSFRPWPKEEMIASGGDILQYLNDTVAEYDLGRHIRFGQWAERISWSSENKRWTVETRAKDASAPTRFSCNFLFSCTGYYRYDKGYTPDFKGKDKYKGEIVHPQKWTSEVDYAGKKVIVIGSGATAITLIPELAKEAEQVTMLQRSPTYIFGRPSKSPLDSFFRTFFPKKTAFSLIRWKYIRLNVLFHWYCKKYPEKAKRLLIKEMQKALGEGVDASKHFTPSYNPWDQRLCLAPDGDFFQAIKKGTAEVVTDHIEAFTEKGVLLKSGQELEAEMVVTATGLNLLLLGNMEVVVDGERMNMAERIFYRSCMFSDIPNLAMTIGYTSISWSLKCQLIGEYVSRVLNYMDENDYQQCCPRQNDPNLKLNRNVGLNSGYFLRAAQMMPQQGAREPWLVNENYLKDVKDFRKKPIADGVLVFN